MGKRFQSRPPSRAVRLGLSAVLAIGLMPWGGVAVAAEGEGGLADAAASSFASVSGFYGWTSPHYSFDENGYPLYDENGNPIQELYSVDIRDADLSGDTLVVPKTFDMETSQGNSENITPKNLGIAGDERDGNALVSVKHLILEDSSNLDSLYVRGMPSLESIEVRNANHLTQLIVSECANLSSLDIPVDSIRGLGLVKCPKLNYESVLAKCCNTLTNLSLAFCSGALNFDGSSFPNLERCSFNSLDLQSYDFLPCSKLESLNLYSCGLDFVDLSKIPQSVTSFSCQGNRIADTTPIVERFGDGAKVDGQFSNMSAEPNWGIHVIDDECANGYLMPGASVAFDTADTYLPTMDKRGWLSEDRVARNALSNYSVESSDPSVVSCKLDENGSESGIGGRLVLDAVASGTATIKVHYSFQGRYRTYEDDQVVDVVVSAEENPIASIESADSLSFNAVTDCAICKAGGVDHVEQLGTQAYVLVRGADSAHAFTLGQDVRVSSSDESVVSAYLSRNQFSANANLEVCVGDPGDAVLTLTAYKDGNQTGVEKKIAVHVGEQVNPTLVVQPEATIYMEKNITKGASIVARPNSSGTYLSSYEANGAIEALKRQHVQFDYGVTSSGYPDYVPYVTATSDNPEVATIKDGYLSERSAGVANITISDIWGNQGTCKVTVVDRDDIGAKLSLTQDELTVEQGKQLDMSKYIAGLDKLTESERSALQPLVFKTGNTGVAVFKSADGTEGLNNQDVLQMLARGVGDTTVTLCYPTSARYGSYVQDVNNWEVKELGSMTIHVIEPKPDERQSVEAPSAPQGLAYTGAEQVGIKDSDFYTVENGSATNAGSYAAKLSLKDKEHCVWASTGTSDDLTVDWCIEPASISEVKVSGIDEAYAYTGKAISPNVKCMFNGKELKRGMDYVLTLSDNVKVGTAKVSIAGKGNFSGTQDKTFTIEKNPAKWMSDSRGWWYSNGDDTYPSSCWKEIDGSFYYFDASGYMKTGWVSDGGKWYYCNGSGAMQTGWQVIGGAWYWFDVDGEMATGWRIVDGAYYLFAGSGAMQTGWQQSGGAWYYLASSGAMATGWQAIGGAWYWFADSGAMATGWSRIGGTYYLFAGSGAMLTGWQQSGGAWYYLAGSGAMQTGWLQLGSTWYWFDASGAMATGWRSIGGTYYFFDGSGAMATNRWVGDYYVTGSGAMATNQWVGGYYVGADGQWQYVYWTPGGGSYHRTTGCPTLSKSTTILHGTWYDAGNRSMCKVCWH